MIGTTVSHYRIEETYREANDIARDQEAPSDELTATTSLARLLQSQSRGEEAREMLAEIYGWFTEGHELPYLIEARELLAELGEPARNPGRA